MIRGRARPIASAPCAQSNSNSSVKDPKPGDRGSRWRHQGDGCAIKVAYEVAENSGDRDEKQNIS